MPLPIGAPAPDFALADQFGQTVRLAELRRAAPVVLVFFPLAFSRTCEGELCALRDGFERFAEAGVQLIGVSVDSKFALRAWAEQQRFDFPLLSDFWPHGEVARSYGAFLEERGHAARATFVIDVDGVVRAAFASDPGQPRSIDQYREALASLGGP
ncbi:peroxiredoxin [Agromyces terreus]|uniref:Alkyl hydroperoxide reductase E n=1 Tax=Agromyces terreus TaxID=424795 RepID=A0A9X2GZB5_9MICO|nr:peroxiredoxin [Agromyces terreus]MCP2371880.1 peroxiredoxin [Agromyces terreus]